MLFLHAGQGINPGCGRGHKWVFGGREEPQRVRFLDETIRRVPPCAVKTCAVRPVFTRVVE